MVHVMHYIICISSDQEFHCVCVSLNRIPVQLQANQQMQLLNFHFLIPIFSIKMFFNLSCSPRLFYFFIYQNVIYRVFPDSE